MRALVLRAAALVLACLAGCGPQSAKPPGEGPALPSGAAAPSGPVVPGPPGVETKAPAGAQQIEIDLDKAADARLPELKEDLKPVVFATADGKDGWAVRIPGNRPIATPAYADGLLFVGGGYGSHEFYAFDARTGAMIWQIKTSDDGPTAAVVEDGFVAFNTESCTVIVVGAKTGKLVWQEWLGDPLMSQPAIAKGRLYMAHPAGQRGQNAPAQAPAAPAPHGAAGGHKLLCAELKTGRHLWEQDITADVISAPVLDGDEVYFTCFDGTSFCLKGGDGSVVWKKQNAGTSAPTVAAGQVIVTQKGQKGSDTVEGIKRLSPQKGEERDKELLTEGKAEYLVAGKGGNVGIHASAQGALDSSVGFASAPASAQLATANSNLGINSVAGAWAYQGSRAAFGNGQVYNGQGNFFNCLRADDGRYAWRGIAKGAGITGNEQVFSPPALGAKRLYLCTLQGHVLSVDQKEGKVGFLYATRQPMAFQPALAGGCLYAGTVNGMLVCLKTGDADADGWTAWGGNAQHNRKIE